MTATLEAPTTTRRKSALTIPQITRLSALSRVGISDAAVARVLKLDLGLDLSAGAVRYYRRRYGNVTARPHGKRGAGLSNDRSTTFTQQRGELVSVLRGGGR